MMVNKTINVPMHCASCENRLEATLRQTEGVIRAEADHRKNEIVLRFDPERISEEQVRERIQAAGFDAR